MAEGGDWGGDAVTSTSSQQKGGKLTQVGKVLKRLWPGTKSKKDGQNTGTTTEKQSRIESRTSMECEAAEEEREQCKSRERGIGDVVHGPGTDPSGEIHHDRASPNKESSSLIQGAEQQNTVIPIHTMAEVGNKTAAPVTSTTRTDTDIILAFSELLTQWSDYQLFQLTKFYRERLKQAIEEKVESLGFMMRRQRYFSEQEHGVSGRITVTYVSCHRTDGIGARVTNVSLTHLALHGLNNVMETLISDQIASCRPGSRKKNLGAGE
ncbi:uncharacterized protein LOC116970309 isoform X1 [Amblyraja radiata]|uniref:uncharacterized protein LOC116970309 isoform X1 n=1 Tax=Amblyraja radiata TaxID=386614 RepID=UPI001402932E|nr:uncharacterized protein LOC116970309 isoform X1 [Amblyraja radiata]